MYLHSLVDVIENDSMFAMQWWNPTIEEQAIDRAHRIGQTRTVHVTRITIAGTGLLPACLVLSSV